MTRSAGATQRRCTWRRSSRAGQRRGSTEELSLYKNQIGDEGCKALAAALGLGKEGAAPRLEKLDLHRNQICVEGCRALAATLNEGAAPSLKARDAPPSPLAPPRQMAITPPASRGLRAGALR